MRGLKAFDAETWMADEDFVQFCENRGAKYDSYLGAFVGENGETPKQLLDAYKKESYQEGIMLLPSETGGFEYEWFSKPDAGRLLPTQLTVALGASMDRNRTPAERRQFSDYAIKLVQEGVNVYEAQAYVARQKRYFISDEENPNLTELMQLEERINSATQYSPYYNIVNKTEEIGRMKARLKKLEFGSDEYEKLQEQIDAETEKLTTLAKDCDPDMLRDIATARKQTIVEEQKFAKGMIDDQENFLINATPEYLAMTDLTRIANKIEKENAQTEDAEQ